MPSKEIIQTDEIKRIYDTYQNNDLLPDSEQDDKELHINEGLNQMLKELRSSIVFPETSNKMLPEIDDNETSPYLVDEILAHTKEIENINNSNIENAERIRNINLINRSHAVKLKEINDKQQSGGQSGGKQINYDNYKKNAHMKVSDYINKNISEYENSDTDTSAFLQNINNKLNELSGGNNNINNNTDTDTSVFLQNINKKLNELTGGQNVELNSSVSTEHFLNYIENKLNHNLQGGDINNILQDSFLKGMNKGGYLKNKKKISQQDILNRIRMSGGGKKDDEDDSSSSSSDSDSDSDSDKSSSSSSSKNNNKNKKKYKNDSESSDTNGGSDSRDSDYSKDSSESLESDDKDDENYTTQKGGSDSDDSLSSIIISSGGNSETPYMISDSLHTEDINLVSFSPKQKHMNRSSKKTKKSSKKSSKKSKK